MKISLLFPETLELTAITTVNMQATHAYRIEQRKMIPKPHTETNIPEDLLNTDRMPMTHWLMAQEYERDDFIRGSQPNPQKKHFSSTCAHRHAPLHREKKTYRKEKKRRKYTERPRSKEEKTKRTGVGERDRGKREGEAEVILAVQPFLEHYKLAE